MLRTRYLVVLYGGTHRTPIQPAASGQPERHISFGAAEENVFDTAESVQVFLGWDARPEQARLSHNDILYRSAGEPVFGLRPDPPTREWALSEHESACPELAAGNIERDPMFVDPEARVFRPERGGSAERDNHIQQSVSSPARVRRDRPAGLRWDAKEQRNGA